MTLTTRMLTPDTWDDFAALVESNNGVWGGCWCMGFHPGGSTGTRQGNRDAKQQLVQRGAVHQVLVYDGDRCVGWCQFGTPPELPNIKSRRAYDAEAAGSTRLADRLHLHELEGPRQGDRGRRGAAARWTRSSAPAEASSRPIRNRRRIDRRSAARISIPDPKSCTAAWIRAGPAHRQVAVGHAHDGPPIAAPYAGMAAFPQPLTRFAVVVCHDAPDFSLTHAVMGI